MEEAKASAHNETLPSSHHSLPTCMSGAEERVDCFLFQWLDEHPKP